MKTVLNIIIWNSQTFLNMTWGKLNGFNLPNLPIIYRCKAGKFVQKRCEYLPSNTVSLPFTRLLDWLC